MEFIKNAFSSIRKSIEEWIILKERLQHYREKMKESTTFNSWKKYAIIVDKLEEKNIWKNKKESSLYDYKEVSNTLNNLIYKRERDDIEGMMHILRGILVKNIFSINTSYLYSYANYGTKKLIEDFLEEIHLCLEFLIKQPETKFPLIKKLEFFSEAKHSYGRTALMLSGGAIFGLYHIGIIVTLLENNLLPQVVCGSSVGSIVASSLCCLNYDELYDFLTRKHEEYDGPFHLKNYNDGLLTKITRLTFKGAVRDVEVLRNYLQELLGDITFKEAYHKTGRILNINVTGKNEHDHNKILNYITAPNVLVFSAAAASSAAPVMFNPTELLCKNEFGHIVPFSTTSRKKFIDGSLSADVPMKRLGELFNVNTFLVSQVNPWVFPFLDEEDENKNLFKRNKISIWTILKGLVISEIRHRIKQFQKILPHSTSQLLNLVTQDYTGDITIFPEFCFKDILHLVTNPTGLDYHRFKIYGNRTIFQKISMIESIVKTELLLEKYYYKLKNKLQNQVSQKKTYSHLQDQDDNIAIKLRKDKINLLNNFKDPFLNFSDIKYLDGVKRTTTVQLNNKLIDLPKNVHFTKANNDEIKNILSITNDHSELEFIHDKNKNTLKYNAISNKMNIFTSDKEFHYQSNDLYEIKKYKNYEVNNYDCSGILNTLSGIDDMDFDSFSETNYNNDSFDKNRMLKRFNNSELNLKLLEEFE